MDEPERRLLETLSARHARSARGYQLAAALLLAGGLAVAALGWYLPERYGFALIAVGLLAGGLAVLPVLEAVERRERVEGLAVLAEDWADLVGKSEAADTTRRELWLFLQRLYDKKAAGSSDVQ